MSSTRACRNVHGSDKRRAILGANPLMTLTRGRTRIPTEWRHNSLPYGFCMRTQTAFVLLPPTGSSCLRLRHFVEEQPRPDVVGID